MSAHANRPALEARQLVAVRSLLSEYNPVNAFYATKLRGLGEVASVEDFCRRAPFTTKAELVADQLTSPPFGTNLTFALERYTRFNQTSGTSGTPLRWLDTDESWAWMLDGWTRVLRACCVTTSDRAFFAFSFGPYLGFWTAFEAATRLGCLCIPGGGMSSAARLRTIVDNGVTVLCCTPTYALRLGEVASDDGLDLAQSQVRAIIVAGEPGGGIAATRARLEALWPGARVFDHHGMTEVGPVTYPCSQRTGVLHVMEDAFVAEIINPSTGQAVSTGERGELVLTTLGRTGSPLIRYRTGDLAQVGEAPCVCGSHELALVGGILGRTDDMVLVRGVNVYPAAVEAVVRSFAEVAEYSVEVTIAHALTELRLRIEPTPSCSDAAELSTAVADSLRVAFNLRIPVAAVAPGTLPRFELKAQRWARVTN